MASRIYWKVGPDRLLAHVRARAVDEVNKLGQKIFTGVVGRSPVYTGSFRASWTASLNTPNYVYNKGGAVGAPMAPPSYPLLGIRLGDTLHISNGAPYSLKLENGWSKQAPGGILRVTLAQLRI